MSGARIAEVESALAASRAGADRRLVEALRQAHQLEADAAADAVERGRSRIAELEALRESIGVRAISIDIAAIRLAEAMAKVGDRLIEIDEARDFSAPPWRTALGETVARNLEPGV